MIFNVQLFKLEKLQDFFVVSTMSYRFSQAIHEFLFYHFGQATAGGPFLTHAGAGAWSGW